MTPKQKVQKSTLKSAIFCEICFKVYNTSGLYKHRQKCKQTIIYTQKKCFRPFEKKKI